MSTADQGRDDPLLRPTDAAGPPVRPDLATRQWRQLVFITLGAVVIFAGLRRLPTGTNLSHMDFRVDPKAGNVIEFCDPLNPQFIPVVAARSPVTMRIATAERPVSGREVRATITLRTASGKAVAPDDLLVTHTRSLHLLIIDPSLADYQHVHPEAAPTRGEWVFAFTPRATGAYRVFADFTPAATGRGLYASVDLAVVGEAPGVSRELAGVAPAGGAAIVENASGGWNGNVFALAPAQEPVRAGVPIDLQFAISRPDGEEILLQPVMGAYAHLVAFDESRSGFAHLHPAEADLLKQPDSRKPVLNFKLTIPEEGRYVIWAQVNAGGNETFVPFDLTVVN